MKICNCIKEVSAKLEEHLKNKIKPSSVYSYDKTGFDNECIIFNTKGGKGILGNAIGIPFSVSYHRKKVDGSRSSKVTIVKTNLFMTYCPLCGKKYPTRN